MKHDETLLNCMCRECKKTRVDSGRKRDPAPVPLGKGVSVKWISVKDRLPDKTVDVLVVNVRYGVSIMRAIYNHHHKVFVLYDPVDIRTVLLDITHWMEIPKVPKNNE